MEKMLHGQIVFHVFEIQKPKTLTSYKQSILSLGNLFLVSQMMYFLLESKRPITFNDIKLMEMAR